MRTPTTRPGIALDDILFRLTQLFRFATKFAERTTPDGELKVDIRLVDIGNRPLRIEGVFDTYMNPTTENELSHSFHCSKEDLKDPDQLAVKATFWFCERLNWDLVTETSLINVQGQILQHL